MLYAALVIYGPAISIAAGTNAIKCFNTHFFILSNLKIFEVAILPPPPPFWGLKTL